GYGLFLLEEERRSPSGGLYTTGPGTYKIPGFSDIPVQLNVTLLKGSSNPRAVYSSKAIGEPPLFLAASIFFAIRHAIAAARADVGLNDFFQWTVRPPPRRSDGCLTSSQTGGRRDFHHLAPTDRHHSHRWSSPASLVYRPRGTTLDTDWWFCDRQLVHPCWSQPRHCLSPLHTALFRLLSLLRFLCLSRFINLGTLLPGCGTPCALAVLANQHVKYSGNTRICLDLVSIPLQHCGSAYPVTS
ncbi:hypothetical protein NP493_8633g00000, partial [Ridgeia piscesae]